MVTDVGAPLLVKIAVPSGTVAEFQLLPCVHSEAAPAREDPSDKSVPFDDKG